MPSIRSALDDIAVQMSLGLVAAGLLFLFLLLDFSTLLKVIVGVGSVALTLSAFIFKKK